RGLRGARRTIEDDQPSRRSHGPTVLVRLQTCPANAGSGGTELQRTEGPNRVRTAYQVGSTERRGARSDLYASPTEVVVLKGARIAEPLKPPQVVLARCLRRTERGDEDDLIWPTRRSGVLARALQRHNDPGESTEMMEACRGLPTHPARIVPATVNPICPQSPKLSIRRRPRPRSGYTVGCGL